MSDTSWTPAELALLDDSPELLIATPRADGSLRKPVPIWMVTVDGELYVRTWHRRDTGWFGAAVSAGRARVQVGELIADVTVQDCEHAPAELLDAVSDAYRAKYAGGVDAMVNEESVATTLRLVRADA